MRCLVIFSMIIMSGGIIGNITKVVVFVQMPVEYKLVENHRTSCACESKDNGYPASTSPPTYFSTRGFQQPVEICICAPSQVSSTTSPRLSRVFRPILSSIYKGCRRIGTIVFVSDPDKLKSSGGAYEPNQPLSLGTTVLSSEKRTRISLLREARFWP